MWKWLLTVIALLLFVSIGFYIEPPKGTMEGNVQLQSFNKKNSSYSLGISGLLEKNTRVLVSGPVTRGAYIDAKGKFKISGLPVGKYTLKIRANGYSSEYRYDVEVKESQLTKVKLANLYPITPSIKLSSDQRVFTSEEKPYFWSVVSGLDKVNYKLYNFDPRVLLHNSKDVNSYSDFVLYDYSYGNADFLKDLVLNKSPIKIWDRNVKYSSEDTGSANLKIDSSLSRGSYLLVVEGHSNLSNSDFTSGYWFSVSDIGLITKHDKNKLLVKATNLLSLKSEPNFNLKVYDRSNFKMLGSVNTNNEGIAEVGFAKLRALSNSLLIFGQKGDNFTMNASNRWEDQLEKYSVYLYTERPIYKPGQTIYFKGIIREKTDYGIKNLPGYPISLSVYDTNNEPIKSFKLKANKFGAFSGKYELPASAPLGSYSIVVTNGEDSQHSANFEVAEYRKPEYKVEVIPGSQNVLGGNTTSATIKANYFFGYPVTNAKVKYTIYAKPDYSVQWSLMSFIEGSSYYDNWDDAAEDDQYYVDSYSGSPIAEGYATTDQNGEAKIQFATKKIGVDPDYFRNSSEIMPQEYRIEAEVTDISRKTAIGMNKFTVLPGEFALFITPDSYMYNVDQDMTLKINAVSFDKLPVQSKILVQFQKWDWDPENYEYKNKSIISETETVTAKNGEAIVKMHVPKDFVSQDYKIVAMAKDKNGNDISAESIVWVNNINKPTTNGMSNQWLALNLDKKTYKPGDVAKVGIVSPIKNVQALLTIEREKIYSYKLIDINTNNQIVQIPVTKELSPNFFVSVCMIGPNKQLYIDTKMIRISQENKILSLDIKTDKKKYKPGEIITYILKALDSDGKPVIADFSLGVVDESVYSLREDLTQNIKKFFSAIRSNNVTTTCSSSPGYSAGPDKIQPRLRKNFKDTAFWKADVITDKNGNAKVSFKLPDNLTTWRATIRAVTDDTKVGSAIAKTLVTQDIIVRLSLPRFYTLGDKATLATIVNNYTDKPQNIKLDLILPKNIAINSYDKNSSVFLNVPPSDSVRKDWEIEAKAVGDAKLKAYALSTTVEGDALELPVKIIPFGISKNELSSGIIQDSSATKEINTNILGNAEPGTIKWNLNISASNASSILGSLDYLIEYPYGCTEQTMSKFLPSLVAKGVSKSLGIQLNSKSEKKLPMVVEQSLKRLYDNQHSDGGWGWWQYDDSAAYMTAYVLYGLKYAEDNNYNIDKHRFDTGTKWLKQYLVSKDVSSFIEKIKKLKSTPNYTYSYQESDFGYVSYVSTLLGIQNNNLLSVLYSCKANLANIDLAYLALSFSELGQKDKASKCLDTLLERTEISAPIVGFSSAQSFLRKFGITLPLMYGYSDLESTSVALMAMLKIRPNDSLNEKIANFILSNKDGNYWCNTKTTANVILAFSEYLKQNLKTENPNYDFTVKLGSKLIKKVHVDRTNLFAPEMQIEIPINLVRNSNKLTITKSGEGKLYYSSDFSYYQHFSASETIPANNDNSVAITKELFKVNSSIDKDGNLSYKESPVSGSIKAGDLLLVKLKIKITKEGQYLLLEDPKASGMELVSSDPRSKLGYNDNNTDDEDNYYWWDFWWTNQEDRDTHMAFFMDKLLPGTYDVSYLVRPELPGKYLIRPAQISGMYSNAISGSTTSMVLNVEK